LHSGTRFIFTKKLPVTQNIQRVESVFVNKHGVVCSRTNIGVRREEVTLAPLETWSEVGVSVDLNSKSAFFRVVSRDASVSCVVCDFSQLVADGPISGCFGLVIKKAGAVVRLEEPAYPIPVKGPQGQLCPNSSDSVHTQTAYTMSAAE
jgi:hypothetical protein